MYYWNRGFEPDGLCLAISSDETHFDWNNTTSIQIDGLLYLKMYKFTQVFKENGVWYMYFTDFVRSNCLGSQTGYATSTDGIYWTAQNLSLLVGQDPDVHKLADNLYVMYYGPDGYFDQYHNQVDMALYQGNLDDLKANYNTPYAYWSFNDGQGTTANDITGYGNDGVLVNMNATTAWVAGKVGNALSFNGIDNYVNISHPQDFDFERDFTWTAWIKTATGGTVIARAPATGDWVPGGKSLFVINGKLRFDFGSVSYVESTSIVNDGQWHHVAVTAQFGVTQEPLDSSGFNDKVQLYVDGQPDGLKGDWDLNTYDLSSLYCDSAMALKIGATSDNFGGYFQGILDDVRIYDQALDSDQINNLANLSTLARDWKVLE